MGNAGARAAGLEKAPVTLEDVTSKLIPFVSCAVHSTFPFPCFMELTQPKIAEATREKTSGKFFNLDDGTELPY